MSSCYHLPTTMDGLLKSVHWALNAGDFIEADSRMLYVCTQFLENNSHAVFFDANLSHFFSMETGVIPYLNKITQEANVGKLSSCNKSFITIHSIIKKYPDKAEDYLPCIIQLCLSAIGNSKLIRGRPADILQLLCSLKIDALTELQLLEIYAKIKEFLFTETDSFVLARYLCILAKLTQHHCAQSKIAEVYQVFHSILKGITKYPDFQHVLVGAYEALDELFANDLRGTLDGNEIYEFLKRDAKFNERMVRHGNRQCVVFISRHISRFEALLSSSEKFWFNTLEYWLYSEKESDVAVGFAAYDNVAKTFAKSWQRSPSQFALFSAIIDNLYKLLTTSTYPRMQTVAVRSLGYMASICAACMPRTKFDDLFTTIIQRIEYSLIMNAKQDNKAISFTDFADHVETIQRFFKESMKSKMNDFQLIKRVIIALFKVFPNLPDEHHARVVDSLYSMFETVWSMSITVRNENKLMANFISDVIKEGTFWSCRHDSLQDLERRNSNQITYLDYLPLWLGLFAKCANIRIENLYFDEHMKVLMRVCLKSQLNAAEKAENHDNMIFHNFALFYSEMLIAAPEKQFKRWVNVISSQMIRRSVELPSVRGFYQLITACLRKLAQICLFSKESVEQKEYVKDCFRNIKEYIGNLLKEMKYFNADLQQECLRLILASPSILIREQTFDLTEIFAMLFEQHSNNFQLAESAIDTLETWMKDEAIVTRAFLRKIVPYFDGYLRYTIYNENSRSDCADLTHLQHKILLFLAKLPDEIVLEITSKSSELQLRKASADCLKLRLSNEDSTVHLKLDEIYYRALDLALKCSNRQMQLLACEVLHSQFTLFLGASQFNSSPDVDAIFKQILPNLLRLAANYDAVISDLFRPIMVQMAHWYANPKNVNSSFSPIFVRCLLEGASNGCHAAIRDVAGKVLQEFVSWTIKQNENSSLINNLHNIKLIIENIKLFSLHPDEGKRFGASVIFLSIHKEMCNEETLVNMFLLELLYAFVSNLSLAENSTSLQLISNVNDCLGKLKGCLIENQNMFHAVEGEHKRITPPAFQSNSIDGIAQFLIQHAWSNNWHCRRQVMGILNTMSNIPNDMFKEINVNKFSNDVNPNFLDIQTTEGIVQYYGSLTCWIDGQIFCIKHAFLKSACDSKLFDSINFVLSQLMGKDFKSIQAMLNISPKEEEGMLRLRDSFASEQVILTKKLLHLFRVLLDSNNVSLINEHFLNLIVKCLFERNSFNLTQFSEDKWANEVNSLLTSYFDAMRENKSTDEKFVEACNRYIQAKMETLKDLHDCSEIPIVHLQFIRGLIQLQASQISSSISIPMMLSDPLGQLFKEALPQVDGITLPKLNTSFREYYSLVLELVLDINNHRFANELQILVKFLKNTEIIKHPQLNNDIEFGDYIFLTFKSGILKSTLRPLILEKLFAQLLEEASLPVISRLFKEYLAHLQLEPSLAKNEDIRGQVFNILNSLWNQVFRQTSFDELIELIQELHQTFGVCNNRQLFENVWHRSLWNRNFQPAQTPLQKIKIEMKRIRLLGMIAAYTDSKEIEDALEDIKKAHLSSLCLDFDRITTTLFINNLIEATFNSTCINFIMYAVDLFLRLESDCKMDANFCAQLLMQLPQNVHEILINAIYDIDISNYKLEQKIKQTQIVCDLLAYCSYDIFESFFVRQIRNILDAFSLRCIENKILSCILINRLFGSLSMSRIHAKTCRITKESNILVDTGRELIKRVASDLLNIAKITAEANHPSERFRLYQCYTYNALASLICNALPGKSEFYSRLFMRKNERGQDILWSRLLQNMTFNFEVTSQSVKSKREMLSDIQTQANEEATPRNYIESQPLFFSSLSEDITNFDFSNVLVRENVSKSQTSVAITISDLDILRHECILHICAVIKHLYEYDMLPAEAVPEWINDISDLLFNSATPTNVRQFLSKIIEISQEYLKQYAGTLAAGIIQTIVDTCHSINSLASDLIIMLLTTWNTYKPSHAEASLLLNFIMRNIWNEDMKLFKFNTSLMKKLIESHGKLKVAYDFIESIFTVKGQKRFQLAGVYILNILAVNEISPFRATATIPIFTSLLNLLESPSVQLALATAETLGVILQYFKKERIDMLPSLADELSKYIREMLQEPHFGGLSNRAKVIQILEAIAKHYPEFVHEFLDNIVALILEEKIPTMKALTLKVFLNCISAAPDPKVIRKLNVLTWLKADNLEVQIRSLEIICNVLDHMEFAQIEPIVNFFLEMPNGNIIYRSIVTDIFIRLCERYRNKKDAASKELYKVIQKALICAFVDPEPEIRNKVCKFWETSTTRSVGELLLDLLENFYTNDCEHLFMSFCSHMLLKSFRISDRPLFQHSLNSCEYRDNTSIFRKGSVLSIDDSSRENEEFIKETRNSYNKTSTYVDIPELSDMVSSKIESLPLIASDNVGKKFAIFKKRKNVVLLDKKVVLYGAYKTGDFPFIQINAQAIVNPMIELSKTDPSTSHLLFTSIFDAIQANHLDNEMLSRLNDSINHIFCATKASNTTLIKSLLHIAYNNPATISCDAKLIAKVSIESGAIANGCLLLEGYLIKEEAESGASRSKKGVAAIPSKVIKSWMKLAELYNKLDEFDAMHGIFQDKIQSPKDMIGAIRAESERRWADARQLYAQLIKIDYDMNRKDLYYEAFLKCSEELCDWKEMEQYCNQAMNVHETTLEKIINLKDSKIGSICLPYYIKSKVMQSIHHNVEFSTQIQQAAQIPATRNVLNMFANHLSLMFFDKGQLKMATTYSNRFEQQFLQSWPSSNPLYQHIQRKSLLGMKNCAEIEILLNACNSCTPNDYSKVVHDISDCWHNAPQYKPTLQYQETRICARQAFLNKLRTKICSEDPNNPVIEMINHLSFNETSNLINLALKEDNLDVARMNLTKATKIPYQDATSIDPVWNLLKSKSILCRAKHEEGRKQSLLLDAFQNYCKCVQGYAQKPSLWIPAALHLRALCEEFIVDNGNHEITTQLGILENICKEPIKRVGDLASFSYETLRTNVIELEALELQCYHSELAEAFLILSKDARSRGEGFVNRYIEFTLKSMKYGSEDARLLFPEILKLDELHTMCESQFINQEQQLRQRTKDLIELKRMFEFTCITLQTLEIPSWMFICWIPQLLAYLDTDAISAIKHIVLQIAIDYPQSIIYAYKVSKEKYSYENTETTRFVERLDGILSNSLIDQFLREMKFVCVPSSFAKALVSRLKKAAQISQESFDTLATEIVAIFNDNRKIVRSVDTYKQQLFEVFDYNKRSYFDRNNILKQLNAIRIDASNDKFNDLGFYSPWLLNFQASNHKEEIEIPGQYTGRQKPLPHYHAKIYKFSQDVIAFPSLRKPIRITCYGNDAKEYRFLVKCGEDLRMDQRIQQLFRIMNSILSKDAHCNEKKFKLVTYEVIPLCNDLGFIQWMENTELLGHLLSKYSGIDDIQSILKAASDKYVSWLSGAAHIPEGNNIYAKAMLRYSKLEATTSFNQIANSIPWDALKQAFLKLSPNIETFFALRHHFIKCYAVMNICNWLLGIGERHPENILLDMDRGNVVGIDFDHAFGSATQRQTVPELVPIRLTPQILNLMEPFGASGMLTEAMTSTLRALRSDYEILLSTMNIFVLEPTLTWGNKYTGTWTPEDNLEFIKAKFSGGNPILIMISEIRRRADDLPAINVKYVECLEDVYHGITVQKEKELSAKEQVDCLIAQATEPNLLARMWQGWAPWI